MVPDSESSHEVLEYLLESGCPVRVLPSSCTVPPTAGTVPEFLGGLRFAGAQVVPIRVYRWKPAPLGGVFDHLVTGIARRQFDAVTFTSAPAAAAVLERSRGGYRGPTVGCAAYRRARDVCRPGNFAAVDPKGRPDVGSRANAVGSLSPPHCRGAAAAGFVHVQSSRPRDRDPWNLCAGG